MRNEEIIAMMASRKRETKETSIEVLLKTDGSGIIKADTGIELLDEILRALARGGGFDLTVTARGDLQTGDHHTAEDTAITLGSTLAQEVKSGIGSSIVPSGQTVAMAAVRFGEPGYQGNFELSSGAMAGMNLEDLPHFLRSLAYSGRFNLAICAKGGGDRSKIEAMSMAMGRAIKRAARDG
jgi:imidazoleglycerol-phosphate dehydratase